MRRLFVIENHNWIDITDKNLVIYGAGQGCIDMMNDLELCNISYVIDGNEKLLDTPIMLNNELYIIQDPRLLNSIDDLNTVIVISSVKYSGEIINHINEVCGSKFRICIYPQLLNVYENINDLFNLDPIMNKKIIMLNLSSRRYEIIQNATKIISLELKGKKFSKFAAIKEGHSKLLFIFGDSDELFVYSCTGIHNTRDMLVMQKTNKEGLIKKYEFMNNHDFDDPITIYRDRDGIEIQHYGNNIINYDDSVIINEIVNKCNKLHNVSYLKDELENTCFFEGFYYSYRQLVCVVTSEEMEMINAVDTIAKIAMDDIHNANDNRVIHGDLTCDNITVYGNKVCFIDWEFLSIGNPMIDLGMLLYSIAKLKYPSGRWSQTYKKCLSRIGDFLSGYSKNEKEFIQHRNVVKAVIDLCFIRDILSIHLKDKRRGLMAITEYVEVNEQTKNWRTQL